MTHNIVRDSNGFIFQVVFLILAPAFLAAGIYLTLKYAVIAFGTEWSRLKPACYTYIFISFDISSLILQGVGGGMVATATRGSNSNHSVLDIGTHIMTAGIIWQVASK